MKTTLRFLFLFFPLFLPIWVLAQQSVIRGAVLDQQSEMPLVGATVQLVQPEGQTPIGAMTDANGVFVLKNVPVGRQAIRVSYLGYEPLTVPNILLTVGKEAQLDLRMQESLSTLGEVVVTAAVDKDRPVNELATISARQFNTEEVQRFSGGSNDVSRLVTNFAGVAAANDSRNDIVIRGNSPVGVLWRIEGVPVPSPNHFATLGTTGGPVSALNPNMIRNSDFLTSAFPAEYGNATAGVFDIGFRQGNQERFEFTAQLAAFSGLEAMAEGPINNRQGTFVVSYRHSFVEVADAAGINVGTTATPRYKDLTFNIDFGQSKFGRFSLFGLGGTSDIDFLGDDITEDDLWAEPNEDAYSTSKLGIFGLKHNLLIGDNTYLRTIVSGSHAATTYDVDRDKDGESRKHVLSFDDATTDFRVSSFVNHKFDARSTLRAGVLYQQFNLDVFDRSRERTSDWVPFRAFDGQMHLLSGFAQSQWRVTPRLTLNAGMHAQHLTFNSTSSIEPRTAVNYQLSSKQTLSAGYGLHGQMQPLPILLYEEQLPDGSLTRSNKDLDFTRSHHFVLGYDLKPDANWHAKLEVYYQRLTDVPVERTPSEFSLLNTGADFGFPEKGSLVNEGSGENLGLELTVEKFFSNGWYGLLTGSLFDSKYTGSDGVERNTAFNGNYVLNVLAGKEFKFGRNRQNAFTLDTRLSTAGGRPYTPVDLDASVAAQQEVLTDNYFGERHSDYFRWDIKVGYRLNSTKRRMTQHFFLDFQNVTNHQNVFQQRFSPARGTINTVYQRGFFPDVLWRVQF
ncbi:MAG: TonB-dependent receptor [Saprospiraceae bacterium]|nr:TonB-dependent receptor [Saprospiraceae bacterium]